MLKKYLFLILASFHLSLSPMMFQVSPLIVLAQLRKQKSKKQRTEKHLLKILRLLPQQLWQVMFEYLGNSMHFEKAMEYDLLNPDLVPHIICNTPKQFVLQESHPITNDYVETVWDVTKSKPKYQKEGNHRNFDEYVISDEFSCARQRTPRGLTWIYNSELDITTIVQCDKDDHYDRPIKAIIHGEKVEYSRPFDDIKRIEQLDHHHFVTVATKDNSVRLWHCKNPGTFDHQKLVRTFSRLHGDRDQVELQKFDENHFFTVAHHAGTYRFSSNKGRIFLWHRDHNEPLQVIFSEDYIASLEVYPLNINDILVQSQSAKWLATKYKLECYSRRPTDFELLFRSYFHETQKKKTQAQLLDSKKQAPAG